MSRLRHYAFTLNNYTDEHLKNLAEHWKERCAYMIFGKEVAPTTGTPHLQGYVQLLKQARLKTINTWWKNKIGKAPHIEPAMGTPDQNENYCGKEDLNPTVYGKIKRTGQPKNYQGFVEDAQTLNDLELAKKYPDMYLRYHGAATKIRRLANNQQRLEEMKIILSETELKKWQRKCIKKLDKQDDRKILWIIDPEGGKGKTYLAKYLVTYTNAFYIDAGKRADIAYHYENQSTVIFDLCREKEDTFNYTLLESFKNGMLFSPKYESNLKMFKPPKVVVFANWSPQYEKLSSDRWDIWEL